MNLKQIALLALAACGLFALPTISRAAHGHAAAPKAEKPAAKAAGHGSAGSQHGAPADAHAADPHAPAADAPSAEAVLLELIEGNRRFVSGKSEHPRSDVKRILETSTGQHPRVSVVSCADSRVPVELLLDQGIGDVFAIRVAGNVCDIDEIGTVEYGVEHLGTPLLVVMGHTSCGAVKAVCTHAEVGGSIPQLVDNIVPAVERAQKHSGLNGEALVPAAVEENVWQSISDLLENSAITAELVHSGKLKIVGAVYDIATGEIMWLGGHHEEEALVAATLKQQHAAAGIVNGSGRQVARAGGSQPMGRLSGH